MKRSLRTVAVTRYVTPLREGGSVPAIVEADDDGMYVLKFRGAGQGPKALIAELLAGEKPVNRTTDWFTFDAADLEAKTKAFRKEVEAAGITLGTNVAKMEVREVEMA